MLTNSQEKAFRVAKSWIGSGGKLLKLGGPAGSGKSFLIPLIAELVGVENCLLITPTGKAAVNLQKNGLHASTIHSVIYKVKLAEDEEELVEDEETKEKIYSLSEPRFILKDADTYNGVRLIIIDEGSMVGANLLKDILHFNVPTLIVGDPHQLAPVNDISVFDNCDIYLDEIVRQSKDSPVIWLSREILNGNLPTGVFGSSMIRKGKPQDSELMYATQVLTDTNKRREELNLHMRNLTFNRDMSLNRKNWIQIGDKVVCRTNSPDFVSTKGFMLTNGTQGIVSDMFHRGLYGAELLLDNSDLGSFKFTGTCDPSRFPIKERPPKIEYGYALTVHLSQGSEWDNIIYDIAGSVKKRALYTAVTRAKNSVLVTL